MASREVVKANGGATPTVLAHPTGDDDVGGGEEVVTTREVLLQVWLAIAALQRLKRQSMISRTASKLQDSNSGMNSNNYRITATQE